MDSWSWCLLNEVFWFHFVLCIFYLFIYVYFLFDIINVAPMSIILCYYELGGVWGSVCVCVWVHVCLVVGLGREGPGLGLLFFLCYLWVGVRICLEKCPVIWDVLFYCSPFCIVYFGAFGSMVGKIFGLGLCNSCRFSASLLGIMLLPFLLLQVMYFRALPHSLRVHLFNIFFFLWWYWILYAPCSRL